MIPLAVRHSNIDEPLSKSKGETHLTRIGTEICPRKAVLAFTSHFVQHFQAPNQSTNLDHRIVDIPQPSRDHNRLIIEHLQDLPWHLNNHPNDPKMLQALLPPSRKRPVLSVSACSVKILGKPCLRQELALTPDEQSRLDLAMAHYRAQQTEERGAQSEQDMGDTGENQAEPEENQTNSADNAGTDLRDAANESAAPRTRSQTKRGGTPSYDGDDEGDGGLSNQG